MPRLRLRSHLLLALAACSSHSSATPDAPPAAIDAPSGPDASSTCTRAPAAADRARHVVVSHPYDGSGNASGAYEVLDLAADGTLSRAQHTFTMGPASFGTIAFTPDGKLGVAADDNGKLGVFALADDGTATVVASQLALPYYVGSVVMDPSGANAWILDGDTTSNGGGIYRVDLACDGHPTDRGIAAAGNTPAALLFRGAQAITAGGALLDSGSGDTVELLAWGAPPTRVASGSAFPDTMAIVGGAALTADGTTLLVGDKSGFASVPNRIAVVAIGSASVTPEQVLSPVNDPEAIVASPFGKVAIATDAFGNAIHVLDAGGSGGAWRVRGDVAYQAGTTPPQLPGDAAMILVGALRGRVLVSEVDKVRQLQFDGSGNVTDVGSLRFGSGVEEALGAIGVTP